MNLQEVMQDCFNRSYLGLKSQGFEHSFHKSACLYRDPEGRKCAIGHLIPDEMYIPDIEDLAPNSLVMDYPKFFYGVFPYLEEKADRDALVRFLTNLQSVHDCSTSPNDMERNLHSFALLRNLSIPEDCPASQGSQES